MLINGENIVGDSIVELTNPFDQSVIDTVSEGSPQHVERAVGAASDALAAMAHISAYERSRILFSAYQELSRRAEEFAATICQEVGKTIREARGEVQRATEVIQLSAEETKRFAGEQLPLDGASNGAGKIGFTMRVPAGVVAAIVPFNFPCVLTAHKLGPALAAGNTVVLKPPPQAPTAASMFAQLLNDAGFPPGAVNAVPGGAEVGDALVRDDRVRVVAFGGSDRTGEIVARAAGLKKLLLECGSASSVTVMPSADIDAALSACVRGGYTVAGQMCIHAQKNFVHRDIYDDYLQQFINQVEKLKVGDPRREDTDMGPVIDEPAARRLDAWIAEAVQQGAQIATGATRQANLFAPTVMTRVTPDMKLFKDEVFGPVVSIIPVRDVDEAIQLTNMTRYGLNSGIFTNVLSEGLAFVRGAQQGSVFVNEASTWRADIMPYGGVKRSGIGREGIKYAMDAMTEHKVVAIQT
jgi:glyceraldehyde-3-phosphate dehydrogenase (NADP+)